MEIFTCTLFYICPLNGCDNKEESVWKKSNNTRPRPTTYMMHQPIPKVLGSNYFSFCLGFQVQCLFYFLRMNWLNCFHPYTGAQSFQDMSLPMFIPFLFEISFSIWVKLIFFLIFLIFGNNFRYFIHQIHSWTLHILNVLIYFYILS